MLSNLSILTSLLGLLATVIIAYFTLKDKKTLVFISVAIASLLGLLNFIFQQAQLDSESKKQDELVNLATGGPDNKPMARFRFFTQPDRSYNMEIDITNYGKYPLTNISCEVIDYGTAHFTFKEKFQLGNRRGISADEKCDFYNYTKQHKDEVLFASNVSTLSPNSNREIHKGKVDKNVRTVFYEVRLSWNNQSYRALYCFRKFNPLDKPKLADMRLRSTDEKAVSDLKAFFPLAPDNFWMGFKTTIDTADGRFGIIEFM